MEDQNLERILNDIDETIGPTWYTHQGALQFLEKLATEIAARIAGLKADT